MTNSGIRAFEAAALELSSDLTAIAENIARLAHGNDSEEELHDALQLAIDNILGTAKGYGTRLDELYRQYVRYAQKKELPLVFGGDSKQTVVFGNLSNGR